jgi:hypothetical protein
MTALESVTVEITAHAVDRFRERIDPDAPAEEIVAAVRRAVPRDVRLRAAADRHGLAALRLTEDLIDPATGAVFRCRVFRGRVKVVTVLTGEFAGY